MIFTSVYDAAVCVQQVTEMSKYCDDVSLKYTFEHELIKDSSQQINATNTHLIFHHNFLMFYTISNMFLNVNSLLLNS